MLKSKFSRLLLFAETRMHLQQAGAGLEKIITQSLKQAPPADAPLLAWPVVCGSAVAERTRALKFEDGVLQVEVAGPGWRAELQALAPRYLAMINRYTTEAVRRIEFVVAHREGTEKGAR
jgi:predicted nucleic acid-binding Zn ribbon protein